MEINEWLETNAVKIPSEFSGSMEWVTKARGDYITLEGMEDDLEYLVKFGLTDFVASTWESGKPINIGFNPDEKKWYGWSHRALHGFGVGAECKKGDCGYRPTNKDDFLDDMIRFWSEDSHLNVRGEHQNDGVYIEWHYSHSIANEKLRGEISGAHHSYPSEYGKGEWVAKSLKEAQQMAIDFANSVA